MFWLQNGGWCMHDEATCHYIDMIDQTTLGHRVIKEQFNKVPHVGWQINPSGHSAVQAYLLGAELGFDSLYFARIDYQDRVKRKEDKSLEVIWRGSKTFGSSSQDDPLLYDYNVEQRVNGFIDATRAQANVTVQIISCGQWVRILRISTQSLGSRKWTSLSIMLTSNEGGTQILSSSTDGSSMELLATNATIFQGFKWCNPSFCKEITPILW